MTPLPKKKHAKARSRKRRSTRTFSLPKFVTCPKCSSLRLPHRACPKCGYYKPDEKEAGSKAQKAS